MWPKYYDEAIALAELAELTGLRGIVVESLGQAAATLHHMADWTISEMGSKLRIAQSLGRPVPLLPIRAQAARTVLAWIKRSSELWERALAEPGDDGVVGIAKAVVRVQRARSEAYTIAMQVFREYGAVSEDSRHLADALISDAYQAVRFFDQLGLDRNAIIGLTAMAEVADSIDDKARRNEWATRAAAAAEERGHSDLADKARTVAAKETPSEMAAGASRPDLMSHEQREALVNELLSQMGVTEAEAAVVRPVTEGMVDADGALAHLRIDVCRHLALIYPETAHMIKGLYSTMPRVRVTCRLLGHTTVAAATKPRALLRSFVSLPCSPCAEKDPLGDREVAPMASESPDDVYDPLRERAERPGPPGAGDESEPAG
jgi:hypothetical protein